MGQRREHDVVEVVTCARRAELNDPVHGVHRHPAEEPAERSPVEALRAAGEVCESDDDEADVQHELAEPLDELVQRLLRLEVEVADQVDERERDGEQADLGCRSRQPGVASVTTPLQKQRDERDREDLGESDLASGGLPVDLLPRRRAERREEAERG